MTFFEDNGWVLMLLMVGGIAYWVVKNMIVQSRDYREWKKEVKQKEEENGSITE